MTNKDNDPWLGVEARTDIEVPAEQVEELGEAAKELLDKVEEAEVRGMPPLFQVGHKQAMDRIHPYKGSGLFTEDGQIKEGVVKPKDKSDDK